MRPISSTSSPNKSMRTGYVRLPGKTSIVPPCTAKVPGPSSLARVRVAAILERAGHVLESLDAAALAHRAWKRRLAFPRRIGKLDTRLEHEGRRHKAVFRRHHPDERTGARHDDARPAACKREGGLHTAGDLAGIGRFRGEGGYRSARGTAARGPPQIRRHIASEGNSGILTCDDDERRAWRARELSAREGRDAQMTRLKRRIGSPRRAFPKSHLTRPISRARTSANR